MFKLKKPCNNCPFSKAQGPLFGLSETRINEIVDATAFQCHKTLEWTDEGSVAGVNPQQCAGLMGTLLNDDRMNEIMVAGIIYGIFDPAQLAVEECYESVADAIAAHSRYSK